MASPEFAAELIKGVAKSVPGIEGSEAEIALHRSEFIKQADSIGSLPMIDKESRGEAVLLDKLGERLAFERQGVRLAFERQGVRLYEALINKCESLGNLNRIGPSLEDLRHIQQEEKEHFALLEGIVTESGGDPTVQTPSADVSSVFALGPMQVLTDPRTTMSQCLQAVLTTELTDNDGWELLKELATAMERADLAEQFEEALSDEDEHLEKVRFWLSGMVLEEADVKFELAEDDIALEIKSNGEK
jgi:rubrerythrin